MSTHTMKAVRQHVFGGPEVLRYEDVTSPALARVSARACESRGG